jgi:hypothetical protein
MKSKISLVARILLGFLLFMKDLLNARRKAILSEAKLDKVVVNGD